MTLFLFLFSLLFHDTFAASYDPELTWRTIKTEHFRIHFHQGEEQLAEEFSQKVESIYDTMITELRWTPQRRTEVVLVDRTDTANGYAMSLPYNTIVIFVTAPQEDSTLSLYEDWATSIGMHEFTHTLHIDTNHGVARVARAVVGRISTTNRISPRWMVEGLATFQETRHSNTGRGRSALVDMIKRTAVLEDAFPPLGNLDGLQPNPPAGNLRYLFGQDFIQHVADNHGHDVWTRWIHYYGGSVPYFLPGKAILGSGFQRLYNDWKQSIHVRYEQQAEAIAQEGTVTEGRLLSDPAASCISPSFAPNGEQMVWSCLDLKSGSAIWTADGNGDASEILLKDRGAKNFTWRQDSKAFVYAGSHIVNRFNIWSDVYLHNLESESTTYLTNGARARDPAFSPDGEQLLVVTNRAQNNQLERLTVDQRRVSLTEISDHTQFSTPRFAPDGKTIALSVWKNGRRDLWLYSVDGKPLRRITADAAIDRDPQWSPDGRRLFFSSDRSGVPNIYVIELDTERLWQVTNVKTGAVNPSLSPDGRKLAYQQYTKNGWAIYLLDIDPETWIDKGFLPQPLRYGPPLANFIPESIELPEKTAKIDLWNGKPLRKRLAGRPINPFFGDTPWQSPDESIDSFDQGRIKGIFGEEEDYPFTLKPQRYTPLVNLLPRYWVPFVTTTQFEPKEPFDFLPVSVYASATIGASDPLRHYGWGGQINYRTDANFLGGGFNFTLNRWIPVYSIGMTRTAHPSVRMFKQIDPAGVSLLDLGRYWEKRHTIYAAVNYPYTAKTYFFARYVFTLRDNLAPIDTGTLFQDPNGGAPSQEHQPMRGATGAIQGGWRYAWSQPTRTAISVEDGRIFSLVGSIMHPYLGTYVLDNDGEKSGLTQFQLNAELREYIVNPWVPNHVLAVRLAGGFTLGANSYFGNYQLGGSAGDSAFYVQPDSARMLRGYPLGANIGDMFWLTGLEYRFPIVRFDRGWGVIPAFLRALSANVYIDAGNAFTEISSVDDVFSNSMIGVGAELRLSTYLFWGYGVTGRFGFGMGLTDGGYTPVTTNEDGKKSFDPRVLYFELGGSY